MQVIDETDLGCNFLFADSPKLLKLNKLFKIGFLLFSSSGI